MKVNNGWTRQIPAGRGWRRLSERWISDGSYSFIPKLKDGLFVINMPEVSLKEGDTLELSL